MITICFQKGKGDEFIMIKEVYTREQAIAEFINNNTGLKRPEDYDDDDDNY